MFSEAKDRGKVFSHPINYQIHCFALNCLANRIIIAGRSEWELLTIGDDRFIHNDIFTKKPNTFRIMDIDWSKLEESLVVSCGSNGELHKLTVGESNISLDFTSKFHERTINKINFHPNEPHILISGGQDGIIKLIDFRCKASGAGGEQSSLSAPAAIFKHDSEDKVTDIQFNPSLSMNHQFASGSENGYAFTWDMRKPNKYERRFKPQVNGGVHLDWHPDEKFWLATASRDRQICVWDLSSDRPSQIHTLTHSESVSSIKWRPKRRTQITACSIITGLDPHLYVWDLMRPYVPYASFDSQTNKVQNFVWRNSPNFIIASTTKQNFAGNYHINLFNIADATRPAGHSTPVTVQLDRSSLAFAIEEDTDPKVNTLVTKKIATSESSHLSPLSVDNDDDSDKFRSTKSLLFFDDQLLSTKNDWFLYTATNYKLHGDSFEEICEHNANVALNFKRNNVYKDWMIFKTIFKDNDVYGLKRDQSAATSSNSESQVQRPAAIPVGGLTAPSSSSFQLNLNLEKFSKMAKNFTDSSEVGSLLPVVQETPAAYLKQTKTTPANSAKISAATLAHAMDTPASIVSTASSTLTVTISSSSNTSDTKESNESTTQLSSPGGVVVNDMSADIADKKASTAVKARKRLAKTESLYDSMSSHQLATGLGVVNQYSPRAVPNFERASSSNQTSSSINNNTDLTSMYRKAARQEEDDDNSMLPNDIIEYNTDLADMFKLTDVSVMRSETRRQQHKQQQDNAQTLASIGFDYASSSTKKLIGKSSKAITPLAPRQFMPTNESHNRDIQLAKQLSDADLQRRNEALDTLAVDMNRNFEQYALKQRIHLTDMAKLNFEKHFEQLLLDYIDKENDLSTAVFMYLVAVVYGKFRKDKIDSLRLDEWFAQYIELLSKYELWTLRTKIVKIYQSDFIKNLTQKSIGYNVMCSSCKLTIMRSTFNCKNCKKNAFICVFCHVPVERLYAWCCSCGHGGHWEHLSKWFKKNSKCPSGCGCTCSITSY